MLQVLGCGVLLTGGKIYCIKKRTCAAHIQAESVMLSEDDSTPYRFCQQCGKFEQLNKFDGTKRCVRWRVKCVQASTAGLFATAHTLPSLHTHSRGRIRNGFRQ